MSELKYECCYNCRYSWWDSNCHCWECSLDGHELTTDYEADEELYGLGCASFED